MNLGASIGSLTSSENNFLAIFGLAWLGLAIVQTRGHTREYYYFCCTLNHFPPGHATLSPFFFDNSFRFFKNFYVPSKLFNCSNLSDKELIALSNITLKT